MASRGVVLVRRILSAEKARGWLQQGRLTAKEHGPKSQRLSCRLLSWLPSASQKHQRSEGKKYEPGEEISGLKIYEALRNIESFAMASP